MTNRQNAHPLRGMADHLAARGRNGDDMVIHVSRDELRGLEALAPRGRLTTNPDTGMPEAFGLGDILGIVGSIAGMAAAPFTGGMSLALTGALGGGLGTFAGNLLEGKDVGSSLGKGLLSGVLGYGMGSAASSLASWGGSEVAKEGAEALVNQGVTPAAMSQGAQSALSPAVGAMANPFGTVGEQAATSAAMGSGAGVFGGAAQGATGAAQAAAAAAPGQYANVGQLMAGEGIRPSADGLPFMERTQNIFKGIQNPSALWDTFGNKAMSTTVPIALGLYGSSMGGSSAPTMPPETHNYPTLPGPNQRRYMPRPADFDINQGREWNYWTPAYADGGQVQMAEPAQSGAMNNGNGGDWHRKPEPWEQFPFLGPGGLAISGIAHGDSFGDIAKKALLGPGARMLGLADGGPVQRKVKPIARPSMPTFEQQLDAFGKRMDENAPSYRGQESPNPFIREPANEQRFARGGLTRGPGSGLDDAIPAIIDGRKPAKLSSGEFVVPAHAVSALGNGSTEAGANQLQNMVSNVMMAKYGTTDRKPRPINAQAMLGGGQGARPFADGGEVFTPLPDRRESNGGTYENIPHSEFRRRLMSGENVWSYLRRAEDELPADEQHFHTYEGDSPTYRQWRLKEGFRGFADGGVIGAITDWWKGNPRPPDPMSSWDMDPKPTEFPSVEDAQAQRIYNIRTGNQKENITNETKMSREDKAGIASALNSGGVFNSPTRPQPIGWDVADKLMAAKMAANTSGVAALGFDPSQTSYTNSAGLNAAGVTDGDNSPYRMWWDTDYRSTPVHEAIHRGHMMIADSGPEGLAAMKALREKWVNGEEHSTRAEMLRRFGPVEKKNIPVGQEYDETSPAAKQLALAEKMLSYDDFRKQMRDVDRVAHKLNAQKVIDKAGGVYARGGLVRRRG